MFCDSIPALRGILTVNSYFRVVLNISGLYSILIEHGLLWANVWCERLIFVVEKNIVFVMQIHVFHVYVHVNLGLLVTMEMM